MSDLEQLDIVVRTFDNGSGPVRTWHDYSVETRAAVAALSRDSCYFPGCRTPIVVFLGDRLAVNVDVSPIRAAEPGSPRYVAGVSRKSVSHFDNLLFLCVPHRKAVDRDETAHPIGLLRNWKVRREAGRHGALTALGEVTADQLDELLVSAFSAIQDQIAEALSRFEKADPESAQLLRNLMQDLNDQRRSVTGSVEELHRYLDTLVTKAETAARRTNIGWTNGS